MKRILGFILLLVLIISGACGGKKRPVIRPPASPPSSVEAGIYFDLEGIASYYGDPFDGRRAANGEIFDKHAMTAAHRTLPFNTRVRVHNLDNKRDVDVRINDRGPYVFGRIIDLSEEAGRRLGLAGPGTARVRLTVLSSPAETGVSYAVQVGAFSNRANADSLRQRLLRRYQIVTVIPFNSMNGVLYRVRVGADPSPSRANLLARQLQGENLPAVVVRLDDQ
jgi:rare lipoprotein A